ncbi:toxic anion resistance protein [Pseudomarimonas arenosa]|uniref:Toxic anion resistance protein n=1 Tax=Pseudomarimonas arenosa TaxID=2774145 RepID=A0AAW3ZUI3_9GAMM|nr:toxic anion resistance protein [Pseudomarimonas arenosa]MBD8528104.1 toxic anion resistance protein [Pseudomarimonas arenosa]
MQDHPQHDSERQNTLTSPTGPAPEHTVPLNEGTRSAVEDQVERFIAGLLNEDLHSEAFRGRLDSAFALGREEIALATTLMQGRMLQQDFVGIEDGPVFQAIQDMREQLDRLNPGRQGDLSQPHRLLGLLPFGTRLQRYFRRFQAAAVQLNTAMQQLYAARDDMQRDLLELETTRARLWELMQKLQAAMHFAETLDARLEHRVQALQSSDRQRSRALEQEVLYPVRQNLQDMLVQQAVCVNGYLALELLKKTAREMINGCNRVATTGISALAVAQTVARASGNQIRVMNTLEQLNGSIEQLVAQSGQQLGQHIERSAAFGQQPMLGMEALNSMFEQTFAAMDALDEFRSSAIESMRQNNANLRAQLEQAERHVQRQQNLRQEAEWRQALAGPVAV